jgi:hypothetical protein
MEPLGLSARAGEVGSAGIGPVSGRRTRRRRARRGRLGASPADSFVQELHGGEAEVEGGSPELGEDGNGGGERLLSAGVSDAGRDRARRRRKWGGLGFLAAAGRFIAGRGRRRASPRRGEGSGARGSATELHRGEEDDGKIAITPLGIFWAALAAAGPACGLRRERDRWAAPKIEKGERDFSSFSKICFLFCFKILLADNKYV